MFLKFTNLPKAMSQFAQTHTKSSSQVTRLGTIMTTHTDTRTVMVVRTHMMTRMRRLRITMLKNVHLAQPMDIPTGTNILMIIQRNTTTKAMGPRCMKATITTIPILMLILMGTIMGILKAATPVRTRGATPRPQIGCWKLTRPATWSGPET